MSDVLGRGRIGARSSAVERDGDCGSRGRRYRTHRARARTDCRCNGLILTWAVRSNRIGLITGCCRRADGP